MLTLIEDAEKISKLLNSISKNYNKRIVSKIDSGKFKSFTIPQIAVMREIYTAPGITLNELSKKVGLANSTVSGIVDRLAKKEVVLKNRPDENKRVISIVLSEEISKKMEDIKAIKDSYTVEILSRFNKDEVSEILKSLEKLAKEVEKD